MSYHWVQTELRAVGMPAADLDPALPADERVRRSIPYLRRMRNTAMAWCLYRIFRDLYDFNAPNVTESNYRDLIDKVARTGRTQPGHRASSAIAATSGPWSPASATAAPIRRRTPTTSCSCSMPITYSAQASPPT